MKIKVENCPALLAAVDVFFGAELTGKVDSNKRGEASTQKRCLFEISVKQMSMFNSSKIAFRWIAKTGEHTITVSTQIVQEAHLKKSFSLKVQQLISDLYYAWVWLYRFSTLHQSHAYLMKPFSETS